jgi:methyl-accepting chemotaxis protein
MGEIMRDKFLPNRHAVRLTISATIVVACAAVLFGSVIITGYVRFAHDSDMREIRWATRSAADKIPRAIADGGVANLDSAILTQSGMQLRLVQVRPAPASLVAGPELPIGLSAANLITRLGKTGHFVYGLEHGGAITFVSEAVTPGSSITWRVVASVKEGDLSSVSYGTIAWIVVGMILIVAIGFLALALLFARTSRALGEMDGITRSLLDGNFRARADLQGEDDLARTAAGLNTVTDSLNRSVGELEDGVTQLRNSAVHILAAAEEQERAATQQSSAIQETASTIEELDLSARQASENAQNVVDQSEEASRQALALSEKVQRINRVTEFIDQISQQIRVLALNASIEASLTEDSGFSVIASEIRRLAEDTRKSTDEIEELVHDAQRSTDGSVMMMEQMVESVRVIGMAMNQQSVATGQITEAMADMNQSMSQALDGARMTVDQSDELSRVTLSLEHAIERLRHPVDSLLEDGQAQ